MESTDETVEKLTKELNEKKEKADSLLKAANDAKLLSEELDKARLAKFEEYEASRQEAGTRDVPASLLLSEPDGQIGPAFTAFRIFSSDQRSQ